MTNRIDIGAELWVEKYLTATGLLYKIYENIGDGLYAERAELVIPPQGRGYTSTSTHGCDSTQLRAIADFMDTLKKEQP